MHHTTSSTDSNNNTSEASWGTYKLKTFAASTAATSPPPQVSSPKRVGGCVSSNLLPLSARQIYQINHKKAQATAARKQGNSAMKFTKILSNLTRAVSSNNSSGSAAAGQDNTKHTQKDSDQQTPTNRGRRQNHITYLFFFLRNFSQLQYLLLNL